MKQFTYVITDPLGIHARPAGLLAKQAKSYAPPSSPSPRVTRPSRRGS